MKKYDWNLLIAFTGVLILILIERFIGYDIKFWIIALFLPLFIIILNQFDILRNMKREVK